MLRRRSLKLLAQIAPSDQAAFAAQVSRLLLAMPHIPMESIEELAKIKPNEWAAYVDQVLLGRPLAPDLSGTLKQMQLDEKLIQGIIQELLEFGLVCRP